MISKFTLFCNLLLTSAALAVPSSRLLDRLASHRENRRSGTVHNVSLLASPASDDDTYSPNWAGVVMGMSNGILNMVTGTFRVPVPTGSDGTVTLGVGIDGYTEGCTDSTIQSGVIIEIRNSLLYYTAFAEWYPDGINIASPDSMTIGPLDVVRVTITASSPSSGSALIENISTGQSYGWNLGSASALCLVDTEWLAHAYLDEDGVYRPVVDFRSVTFTEASTTDFNGVLYTPSEGFTVDMTTTSTSISEDSVTIAYISQ